MNDAALKTFLDKKVNEFNRTFFIQEDPIRIPHEFTRKQDIEIVAFFAAIFAWGNRTTIIRKTAELMDRMDRVPYEFCMRIPSRSQLEQLAGFRHRTFNDTDLLYFIEFFRYHYQRHESLETAFTQFDGGMEEKLTGFHHYFFSLEDVPARTRKHIASPHKGSTCKRLNMFLRWMVRKDNKGVDFGLWQNISSSQLIIPIDVHVARVARKLGLLKREPTDWRAAVELTERLKTFDANDPVKYDFALFAMGAEEKH